MSHPTLFTLVTAFLAKVSWTVVMGWVQGIVGTMPWVAMVFFTLWLQLLGFTDLQASVLVAVFASACSVGGVIGGNIGPSHFRLPHPVLTTFFVHVQQTSVIGC